MSDAKQTINLILAACIFAGVLTVAFTHQWDEDQANETESKSDVEVSVFTLDTDRYPYLLWSTRQAEQAKDGTIKFKPTSEKDAPR